MNRKIAELSLFSSFLIIVLHVFAQFPSGSAASFVYVFGRGLASIAVPYFCLVSGYFLAAHMGEEGWWGTAIRKRMKSLVIPFLFWNMLAWLFYAILYFVASSRGISFGEGFVKGITCAKIASYLGFNLLDYPMHGHYWYVRMLFLFVLISPIFVVCRSRLRGVGVVAFLLTLLVAFNRLKGTGDCSFFWEWTFPLRCLLFLSVGIWLRTNPLCLPKWVGRVALLLGSVLLIVLSLGIRLGPELDLLMTIALLIGIWENWHVLGISSLVNSCAFPIFTLHWFVTRGVQIVLKVAGHYDDTRASFNVYLASLLAAWLVSFLWAYSLRRFLPKFSKFTFGR